MLIDYSIRSFEVVERKLTAEEKAEVFNVFYQVGQKMNLAGLPQSYMEWLIVREGHLKENLSRSELSIDLYSQYKKHLGAVRYFFLKQAQVLVVPKVVNRMLSLGNIPLLLPALMVYKILRAIRLGDMLKNAILPSAYRAQVMELDAPG